VDPAEAADMAVEARVLQQAAVSVDTTIVIPLTTASIPTLLFTPIPTHQEEVRDVAPRSEAKPMEHESAKRAARCPSI